MEKKSLNNRQSCVILLLRYLLPLFIIFYVSCTPERVTERLSQNVKEEKRIIKALIPENFSGIWQVQPAAAGVLDNSKMVLESGNYWTIGIPGFEENALSAFIGEYRIPYKTETIKVWLSGEFLYYKGWTGRLGITGITVREKTVSDGRIIAAALNDTWTLVIQFPPDSGFTLQEENRIMMNLFTKFSGIAGMASADTAQGMNISFPAFVTYE